MYSQLGIRRTYVENDLIKELHRIAAEHQRNNMPINLAPHLVNINSLRSSRRIAVLVKKFPGRIDIPSAWLRRESHLGLLVGSTRVRHDERT